MSYLNKPFYKLKPLGISLDCKRQQIEICHNDRSLSLVSSLICITLALGKNTSSVCRSGSFVDLRSSHKKVSFST